MTPKQPLDQINASSAYRQQDSQALDLSREDRADMATFNDIIWHSVKGKNVAMPAPKTAFHPGLFTTAQGGAEGDDR